MLRFDPSQSVDELREALQRAAGAAWGEDAVRELAASLDGSARAIWLLSQEPLDPLDAEP